MFETNGIDGRRDLARTMPRDSSSSRSLARVAGLILIFALGTPLLLSFIAAGAPPRTADFFEYNYNTYVDQGTDYYFGYSDKMISYAVFCLKKKKKRSVALSARRSCGAICSGPAAAPFYQRAPVPSDPCRRTSSAHSALAYT